MRSNCIAALPHSTCCYTWKLPVTPQMRPVLVDQTHHAASRAGSRSRREAPRSDHSSIPWKTYLASREFKNLASDLADAVFSPSSTSHSFSETERPSSLSVLTQAAGQPSAGSLLDSVLPEAGDAPGDKAERPAMGLALAA
jgi:hypothetical protein